MEDVKEQWRIWTVWSSGGNVSILVLMEDVKELFSVFCQKFATEIVSILVLMEDVKELNSKNEPVKVIHLFQSLF